MITTIDSITRGALFSMQLPIHYYVEALYHSLNCLHELNLDVLQVTKKVRIESNEFSEITLPDDFENVVGVFAEYGQYLIPYMRNHILNELPNLDGSTQIPFTVPANTDICETSWGWFYSYYFNDYGEYLGKNFAGSGDRGGGFAVIPERNVIFLGNLTPEGTVIQLEYIAKYAPTTVGSPTVTSYEYYVNQYAVETITNYTLWKMSRNDSRLQQQNLERIYHNSLRILRARMNELTTAQIKDLINISRRLAIR